MYYVPIELSQCKTARKFERLPFVQPVKWQKYRFLTHYSQKVVNLLKRNRLVAIGKKRSPATPRCQSLGAGYQKVGSSNLRAGQRPDTEYMVPFRGVDFSDSDNEECRLEEKMDVFKLLTRSTNLQKAAPSTRKRQQQKIPSSVGVDYQIQLPEEFEAGRKSAEPPQPRGTKRKRVSKNHNQALESLNGLKYFEEGVPPSASGRRVEENEAIFPPVRKGNEHMNGEKASNAQTLNEEECRRILKRNKLKVTMLQTNTSDDAKTTKKGISATQKKDCNQLSPQPLTSFTQLRTEFSISRRVAENLDAQGFRNPTEVQLGTLPLLLGSDEDRGLPVSSSKKKKKQSKSHIDLLTVAPTGSGKTLAFMVNVLHGLVIERRRRRRSGNEKVDHGVQALVIAPTHELADQIVNEGRKLAVGTGIRISAMKRGMTMETNVQSQKGETMSGSPGETDEAHGEQISRPSVKADVLISTPMILLNALKEGPKSSLQSLPTVRYLVLDEADVLLDPLFRNQTLDIWHACNSPELQTSLWSATIGSSIESLAQETLLQRRRDLKLTSSPYHLIRVVVGLKDSAIPNISHHLTYAATEHGKLLALRQLLHPSAPSDDKGPSLRPPFLIFTQTIQRAIALHSELIYDIPPEAGGSSRIAVLHSDLSDNARSAIMAGFRKGEIWILITTDLLSRGVDFRGMNGVVNYDIPNTGASYVHRVGRTGRQGREGGVAITLYTKEDIPYVKNIANIIAVSEKAKGLPKGSGGDIQKWLLDMLPSVSKKAKQELKWRGVRSRRTFEGKEGGKEARRARISTKSGYERRLQNRRKGAVAGGSKASKHRTASEEEASGEEWGGLDN